MQSLGPLVCAGLLVGIATLSVPQSVQGGAIVRLRLQEAASANAHVFTVESAIGLARERNPLARAEDLSVEAVQAQLRGIEYRSYIPQLSLDLRTGVVPEARGTVLESLDQSDDLDGLGPFYQFGVTFIEPLYTFGRIASTIDAARSGLMARESQRDQVHNRVALEVASAYWGLVAAEAALDVATEMKARYEELVLEVRELLDDEDSDIDRTHVFEIDSREYEIIRLYLRAVDSVDMARRALATMMGLPVGTPVAVSEEGIPDFALVDDDLDKLVERAVRVHPELRGIKSLVAMREARMDLEESKRLPAIYLAGGFSVARAGNRADQTNPFVWDDFNYRRVALAVGVTWNLNFWEHGVEYQQARIERDATLAQAEGLRAKLAVEVHRAYTEATTSLQLVEAANDSRRAARRWLTASGDTWELGIGDSERLLDAYEQFYRLQRETIRSEYEANVSLVKLAFVLGDFELYTRWIGNGKVALD